jgi:hypothetical protein
MVLHHRLWLIALWASSVAGSVVIAGLVLGQCEWATILWAAPFGLLIGVPAALLTRVQLWPDRPRQVGVLGQVPPDGSQARPTGALVSLKGHGHPVPAARFKIGRSDP